MTWSCQGVGCWGLLGAVCWASGSQGMHTFWGGGEGMETPAGPGTLRNGEGTGSSSDHLGCPPPSPGPYGGGGDALAWWQVCSEHFYGLLIVMLPFNSGCHSMSAKPDRLGFMPPNYGARAVRR